MILILILLVYPRFRAYVFVVLQSFHSVKGNKLNLSAFLIYYISIAIDLSHKVKSSSSCDSALRSYQRIAAPARCARCLLRFTSDHFYGNDFYASVGGVRTSEMNRLEAGLLHLLKWRLNVPALLFRLRRQMNHASKLFCL